jgi:hypothetical protein
MNRCDPSVSQGGSRMRRTCVLLLLAMASSGCAWLRQTPKQAIEWPDPASTPLVGAPMEVGAAIAAAAAFREFVRQNDSERLFQGCASPEQGLDVAVFKDPKSGLYFVVLHQRFDRCGGPTIRVLDGWYEYAVTGQGEVLGEAPPLAAEEPAPTTPAPVEPPTREPDPTTPRPPADVSPASPSGRARPPDRPWRRG